MPQSISISAPTTASLTHNQTSDNQAFPAQTWTVRGNTLAGVTVQFGTSTPFVHATNSDFKRDAKLDLALGTVQGPAVWTVTTASDTTNYGGNDNAAQVAAASNGVGRANFNLTVTFLTADYDSLAAGNYGLTVTGTVAAN